MAKVDEVKLVMQENVEIALQNCVTLEHIEKQAEDLEQGAAVFTTRAKDLRSKMWWKKLKMQLLLASIIIIILTAVGLAIYFTTKSDDDDKRIRARDGTRVCALLLRRFRGFGAPPGAPGGAIWCRRAAHPPRRHPQNSGTRQQRGRDPYL